jgi:hypothetical protein
MCIEEDKEKKKQSTALTLNVAAQVVGQGSEAFHGVEGVGQETADSTGDSTDSAGDDVTLGGRGHVY